MNSKLKFKKSKNKFLKYLNKRIKLRKISTNLNMSMSVNKKKLSKLSLLSGGRKNS